MTAGRRIPRALAALLSLGLALTGVALVATPASAATTHTVTDSADTNTSGTLRYLLQTDATVVSGDTIDFAPGITSVLLTGVIYVRVGLTIDGGGDVTIGRANTGAFPQLYLYPTNADQDFVIQNLTVTGIVSGTGTAFGGGFSPTNKLPRDITLSNVTVTNETNNFAPIADFFQTQGDILIEDSTFTGNTSTSAATEGGLFVESGPATVTVRDSTFRDNTSAGDGAALSLTNFSGVTVISGSTFERNLADVNGGAIYASGIGGLQILSSVFNENHADGGGGAVAAFNLLGTIDLDGITAHRNDANGDGGAFLLNTVGGSTITMNDIHVTDGEAASGGAVALSLAPSGGWSVSNSTFENNDAHQQGGAIYASGVFSDSSVTDSTFTTNSALSGGAIATLVDDAVLTVARSSFVGNSFTSGGGSLFISAISDGTLLVDSSTFSGAVETGGGPWFGASIQVASLEGEFDILNSTMDETVVANGSAVSVGTVSAGTVNIAHSSIRGPGGVSIENNDSTTNPRIENSVLESTGAALALALDTSSNGARVQLKYSILNTNLAGLADDVVGNLLATDPQLGALANNGGPRMFTRLPLAGSPAINAGDPAYSGNPAFDERGTGFARLQGTRIDIGAAEVKPALAATGSTVSWWVIAIAAGVVILGVVTLILSRRARAKIEA